jgi:CheY-like chemotaxis protein
MMDKAEILVVEDETIIAKDIQMCLESLGYFVPHTVSSGEEAISLVEQNKPDLVLMDIMLEGEMNGIEAAVKLRSRFDVPVVFLTAYADSKTLSSAKEAQPLGYISKPFNDTDIRVAVEMALFKARAEAEREQLIKELQQALATIKTLQGLIPICAWCKKVRNDGGYWQQVEQYISERSEAEFTHGICPECMKKEFS